MNNIIIGTAGHVDHGKTCLIRALTGIDTDRLEEEKRRGITIELGFAYLNLPSGEKAGIIDVPGHEKFIRNMLAGAGGIDIALLVIAADEGIMPQTREHLGILSLLDVKRGCVAVTKTDMVDEEWLELVLDDIRTELHGTAWENAPIVPVSSYTGDGIEKLRAALFELVAETKGKNTSAPFRLPVDRIFTMPGFGTVVTGTLIEGSVKEGQRVTIYPEGKITRIRNLQVHSCDVEEAFAGQRVAINLLKVKKEELGRGVVLAEPDSMHTSMMLDVTLRVLPDSKYAIKNDSRLHFYHGSEEILCKAVLLGGIDELYPGQECYAQLRFEEPVATKMGDNYVVRFYSPIDTVGGGTVLDPCPYKHKRASEEAVQRLELLHKGDKYKKLETLILEHSPHFAEKDFVFVQSRFSKEEFDEVISVLVERGTIVPITNKVYLHSEYLSQTESKLINFLGEFHKANPLKLGARTEEVRGQFFRYVDPLIAESIIAFFAERNRIEVINKICKCKDFAVCFTPKQEALKTTVYNRYTDGGFAPPEKSAMQDEFGRDKDFQKVIDFLLDEGDLIPVNSELYFTKERISKALELFTKLNNQNGQVTLAEFRDAIGASRKFAVAILEYWDTHGITVMNNDSRTLITGK